MNEIDTHNFKKKLPEIKKDLEEAKFISIDLEFSALFANENCKPSLFDTPAERYSKLRSNVSQTIPLQVGVTPFIFNAEAKEFVGKPYSFYVKPATFLGINKRFTVESASLEFLCLYGFDFNKFVYSGIPFLNENEERILRDRLEGDDMLMNFSIEYEKQTNYFKESLQKWHDEARSGEVLELALPELVRNNIEFKYCLRKDLKKMFSNVSSFDIGDKIRFIKLLDGNCEENLIANENLENALVSDLLGFTEIYRLIEKLRKPIVGHNMFFDIIVFINTFDCELPESYEKFKRMVNKKFPIIFDTKHVSLKMRRTISDKQQFRYSSLDILYEYFNEGSGKDMTIFSPTIRYVTDKSGKSTFHDAGFDSYCTGYVFIKLAYLNIHKDFPKAKTFMFSELINGLSEWKNCLPISRGTTQYTNLGGPDPLSTRPAHLVLWSKNGNAINFSQITSLLSSYGAVEVRPFSYGKSQALIAVDSFPSAKRIIKGLQDNKDFAVARYSVMKHSPICQTLLWSGLATSGCLILYLSYSIFKNK